MKLISAHGQGSQSRPPYLVYRGTHTNMSNGVDTGWLETTTKMCGFNFHFLQANCLVTVLPFPGKPCTGGTLLQQPRTIGKQKKGEPFPLPLYFISFGNRTIASVCPLDGSNSLLKINTLMRYNSHFHHQDFSVLIR